MKRYTDRVEKALNLSKEEFENFLTLLRSKDELSLQVALSMMRGRANATAKEMKAMFAHYVLMPIFEEKRSIKKSIHDYRKGFEKEYIEKFGYAKYKGWVKIQLYYIKNFVRCSPAELSRSHSLYNMWISNVWAKEEDYDIDIMEDCSHFSDCANILYGNNCDYW